MIFPQVWEEVQSYILFTLNTLIYVKHSHVLAILKQLILLLCYEALFSTYNLRTLSWQSDNILKLVLIQGE